MEQSRPLSANGAALESLAQSLGLPAISSAEIVTALAAPAPRRSSASHYAELPSSLPPSDSSAAVAFNYAYDAPAMTYGGGYGGASGSLHATPHVATRAPAAPVVLEELSLSHAALVSVPCSYAHVRAQLVALLHTQQLLV